MKNNNRSFSWLEESNVIESALLAREYSECMAALTDYEKDNRGFLAEPTQHPVVGLPKL